MAEARAAQLHPLRHTYFLLRHGRSLANEAGLVVSTKENGVQEQWRLAPLGREQAKQAGQQLKAELAALPPAPLLIVCSPFSRTIDTATIAAEQVGLDPSGPNFRTSDALVERNFGSDNELKPYHGRYEAVWAQDARSLDAVPGGDGESVRDVVSRLVALVQELEAEPGPAKHILLVAHGDTLSICQAALTPGVDLHHHAQSCPFTVAQLKRLNTGSAGISSESRGQEASAVTKGIQQEQGVEGEGPRSVEVQA